MKFVRRQLAVILIPAFTIFILNFAIVITLASHSHALEFVVEHGVDHLVLIHDIDPLPTSEHQLSDADREDHEFHMPGLTALVKKKLQQLSFESCIASSVQQSISAPVPCNWTNNREFTAHSRGEPLAIVLRI